MKVSAPESIIRACCMLYQELELKHNGESSGVLTIICDGITTLVTLFWDLYCSGECTFY